MLRFLFSILYYWLKALWYKLNCKNLVIGHNVKFFNCLFEENVFIGNNTQVYNTFFGKCSYVGESSFINNSEIGKFCSLGPNIIIGPGTHPSSVFVSTSPYFYAPKDFKNFSFSDKLYFEESKKIHIGNDVWIGCNAVILDGIRIGNGAIISAGAVVTKDVPDYAVVGGIPAKVIKYRFSQEEVAYLTSIEWWNRDFSWIKQHFLKFHNINEFITFTSKTDD